MADLLLELFALLVGNAWRKKTLLSWLPFVILAAIPGLVAYGCLSAHNPICALAFGAVALVPLIAKVVGVIRA